MTARKRYRSGLVLVLLAVVCMSIVPALVKVGLAEAADPYTLLALRLLTATAALWIVLLLFSPRLVRIDRRGLAGCVAVAAANSTSLLSYYLALTYINASVAHMLFSLFPVAALLFLAFRGERITQLSLVRLGMAILGVYLLIGPGGQVDPAGVLLVLGSAVAYALYLTLSQWYLSQYPPQTVALYVISLMTLVTMAARLLQFEPWKPLSPSAWGVVLATGLISTVLARLAIFAGIQRIGGGQTALLGTTEVFLAVLWAMLFLGERLSPIQWAGGMLVVGSAVLSARHRPQPAMR
jgi:drug/metabolite transporter (DMT)-like permease